MSFESKLDKFFELFFYIIALILIFQGEAIRPMLFVIAGYLLSIRVMVREK